MEQKPLKSLVKEAIEASGGLVDDTGERLEVILPLKVATRAGLKEHQYFSFNRDCGRESEEFISYDSPVLDSISQLIDDKGIFCEIRLDGMYLKKENIEEAISRKISFLNSIYRVEGKVGRTVSYLLLNFRYSAISEEKTTGLVSTIVNEVTLTSPKEMVMALRAYPGSVRDKGSVVGRKPLEEVFKVSSRIAENDVIKNLDEFEKKLNRRLNRDIARLQEYYGTLKDEAYSRIEKRSLLGEEKERELSKIRAIELELERKAKEQADRYSVRVELEAINAMRVFLPILFIDLLVKRKSKERELKMVWNPLIKSIEPPVCESCLNAIEGAYLCDEKLHFICQQCYECPSCHRKVCRACYPQSCPRCSVKYDSR